MDCAEEYGIGVVESIELSLLLFSTAHIVVDFL